MIQNLRNTIYNLLYYKNKRKSNGEQLELEGASQAETQQLLS